MDGSNASARSSEACPTASRIALSLTCRQRILDILDLEQILARVRLGVLDRGAHLHQIGVGGEHARIVRDAVLLRDVDDDLALDGPGQMPVVAGAHGAARTCRSAAPRRAPAHRRGTRRSPIHTDADQHQYRGQPPAEARRARGRRRLRRRARTAPTRRRCRLRNTSSKSFCDCCGRFQGLRFSPPGSFQAMRMPQLRT